MTRPPISKLREDVLRAAMKKYDFDEQRRTDRYKGRNWFDRSFVAEVIFCKACALLAEREKGKK